MSLNMTMKIQMIINDGHSHEVDNFWYASQYYYRE